MPQVFLSQVREGGLPDIRGREEADVFLQRLWAPGEIRGVCKVINTNKYNILTTMEPKRLGIDVLTAARERIAWTFDTFEKVYVSFSGGKDSTVMLHLVADEAYKQNKRFGLLFIDWEAQYKLTIDHVAECFEQYKDIVDPYWVALPMKTVNAVSQFEPEWIAWDLDKKDIWVRQPPEIAITDTTTFPFYNYSMTFEEFVPGFGDWYSRGKRTACFVGIRTRESLNRWMTIGAGKKTMFDNKCYTTRSGESLHNIYPIYDWKATDIWTYHGKYPDKRYNQLYDRMYQAGISLHHMRICEPYGSEQRRGLWLFQVIEPDTWSKVVARVNGANVGAIYAKDKGNILGSGKVTLPDGHTWKSFAIMLLESMPEKTSEHYKNKIAVYLHWYTTRGYPNGIPDEQDKDTGSVDHKPSWRRICKVLLRHDYWCKGLSFSPTKTAAYTNYLKIMDKRRKAWNLI